MVDQCVINKSHLLFVNLKINSYIWYMKAKKNTKYNEGDILVSQGFKLQKNLTPFRKVRTSGYTKRGGEVVMFYGDRIPQPSRLYSKVTDEDYQRFDDNLKHIFFIETDDENQHISSVTGEPKMNYKDEGVAFRSAYKMRENKGGDWVIYTCKVCGKVHIGKDMN